MKKTAKKSNPAKQRASGAERPPKKKPAPKRKRAEKAITRKQTDSVAVKNLKAQILKLKKVARENKLIRLRLETSEELYKNLVNTSQDLIWKCDEKGRFTFLNPAWETTLEYSLDEMLGRPFTDFQKPEVARRDIKEFARHLAGGMVRGYETTQITKSGKEVTMLFNAMPLFNHEGKIIGTQGTATDITWSKEAEERLEEQSRQLKNLLDERTLEVRIKNNALESSIVAIAFTGQDGLITEVNPAFLKIWGYEKKKEVVGRSPAEFFERPGDAYEIIGHLQNEGSWTGIKTAIRPDNSTFPAEISASLVKDDHGKVLSMMATFTDITERQHIDALLKQEKAFTENLIRTANVVIVVLNIDGQIELINETAEKIFGYTKEELSNKNLFETIVPRDRYPKVWAEFEKFRESKTLPAQFTNPILRKDNTERIISWQNSVIRMGNNVKTVSFGIDITENRKAQDELYKNIEQYNFIKKTTTDGFWLVNDKAALVDVNDRACELLGYTRNEMLSLHLSDIEANETPEDTAAHMKKIFETGADLFETRHRHKLGHLIDIEISTTYNRDKKYFVAFVRDITERKKNEEELKKLVDQTVSDSQTKTELLKEINHRVKNNLISIQGLLLAEKRYCPEESKVYVESVIDNINNRIGGLIEVHQILSETRWAPVSVSELSSRIVRRVIDAQTKEIKKVKIVSSENVVLISPRQASNVAMIISELATNSIKYALKPDIDLTISLDSSKGDQYIRFAYRDNGPGYPRDVIEGRRKSIGIDLIEKLVKGTLRGTVYLGNDNGAVTSISIKEEEMTRT